LKKYALPLILGILAAVILFVVAVPTAPKKAPVVVAARDLGAGTVLTRADLDVVQVQKDMIPSGSVSSVDVLVGKTLAVPRFKGEPVAPKHLGPAVTLAKGERALALKVDLATGVAGLLRPGTKVGVVATLKGNGNDVKAKVAVEGLKVLYVSPGFMANTGSPVVTAAAEVNSGKTKLLSAPSVPSKPSPSGVVVLAVPLAERPILYSPQVTMPAQRWKNVEEAMGGKGEQKKKASGGEPKSGVGTASGKPITPTLVSGLVFSTPITATNQVTETMVSPVELLAALNARGSAFTLYLMPAESSPEDTLTPGFSTDMILPSAKGESGASAGTEEVLVK